VKAGEIEKETGKKVYKSLELRHKARYRKDAIIEEDDAQLLVGLAEEIAGILEKRKWLP